MELVIVPNCDNFISCSKLWKKAANDAGAAKKCVKEAIRAKKDAFKTLSQNSSSSDLQSQYFEVRKAAAMAVKTSKKLS